ncbi:MAG TPA: RidA family protein [Gemmatimonadota bacterium]|nr:RidA family protein [Gemmatimonadota bacterium]
MSGERGAIHTERAPGAIGPYSQAIRVGEWLFTAGQIGLDPDTGGMVGADVRSQARRVMENLSAVLAEAGGSLDDVVKTTIFLADMDDFSAVNEIYGSYFEPPYPARSTVAAARLPKDARVEIEVVARIGG